MIKFNKKNVNVFLIILIILIILILLFFIFFKKTYCYENYENNVNDENILNKTIWLLWFQGWDNAPFLQKTVAKSWEHYNPEYKIQYLDMNNLKDFINDIDYIYDENKNISYQAKSDIIRMSLLKNHGGVWADSTFLCMQPLDNWIYDAIKPSGFWMYHGKGAGMDIQYGPCSWFIISVKNSYIISKWKEYTDNYWNINNYTDNYFWLDEQFKILFETDQKFRNEWNKVNYLSCEEDGSSHTLDKYGTFGNNDFIKKIFYENPPYGLKFWKFNNEKLENCDNECKESNGYYAIEMSKR